MTRILYSFFIFTVFSSFPALAENFQFTLVDKENKPVANAVVELHFHAGKIQHSLAEKPSAIMDQVEEQFLPHILAVTKGTEVSFPNSDNIKHHVYSFSEAKVFEQGLYKGRQAPPILFDNSGVVDLGCNIHDWMLGYIYVAETDLFAKTGVDGKVIIDGKRFNKEEISHVTVWHPRMQEKSKRITLKLTNTLLRYQLTEMMREDTEGYESIAIEDY